MSSFIALFSVIAMAFFVGSLVWLLVCSLRKKDSHRAGKYTLCSFIASAVLLAAFAATKDDTPQEEKKVATTQVQEVQQTKKEETPIIQTVPTFGLTPEQFQQKFNEVSQGISNGDVLINGWKKTQGAVNDSATSIINEGNSVVGVIDKQSGNLKGITIICLPQGNQNFAVQGILSFGIMISVLNPEITDPKDRGNILKELGLLGAENINNLNTKTNRGNVQYSVTTSQETGLWFSAEAQ